MWLEKAFRLTAAWGFLGLLQAAGVFSAIQMQPADGHVFRLARILSIGSEFAQFAVQEKVASWLATRQVAVCNESIGFPGSLGIVGQLDTTII